MASRLQAGGRALKTVIAAPWGRDRAFTVVSSDQLSAATLAFAVLRGSG